MNIRDEETFLSMCLTVLRTLGESGFKCQLQIRQRKHLKKSHQTSVLKYWYWWSMRHTHLFCYMAKPTLRILLALRHTVAQQFQWFSACQGIENYICEGIHWQKLGPRSCLETGEQLWRPSWSQKFRYLRYHFWEDNSEFFHKHLFLRQRPNQLYQLGQMYSWHRGLVLFSPKKICF